MHKNLTPSNLRCGVMSSCPSINQLEDGRLLIVGTYSPARARLNNVPMGEDETAIVISPEYLSDYISQHVDAAVRAEREACAKRVEAMPKNMQQLLLHMGEMSAQERRSVAAALNLAAFAIRSRGNANG
jgi:hypothetical protein